jgi:hypothetical protein
VRRPSAAMRGLWPWIEQASKRLHRNMLAIALANKLARIAWAVLARGRTYQPRMPQMPRDQGSLRSTKGMPATPLRHHRSPQRVSERRWLRGDGFT